MSRRLVAVVAASVLAVGVGAAVAATHTTSSSGTNVCVNNTNGLVRVADTCRDSEHPLTIGGGGNLQVTAMDTFSVQWGETGGSKVLPLTGITVSGRCQIVSAPTVDGEVGLARVGFEAASGKTMNVFRGGQSSPLNLTSDLTVPLSNGGTISGNPLTPSNSSGSMILTSNGATATLSVGAYVDVNARTCIYTWQAFEAPN